MNVILPSAIIFTVGLIHEGHGQNIYQIYIRKNLVPCQDVTDNNAYNKFAKRHILTDPNLDRNSEEAWEDYLKKSDLCGRTRVQSFIDATESDVQQICREGGWRVKGNLCISDAVMTVYDVESRWVCGCCYISSVTRRKQKVVVACNNVGNLCLPVHYEKYDGQEPTDIPCSGVIHLAS